MFKLSWVSLGLLALIGGFFTVATMPISPAQGAACFSSFSTKTTADGLGSNTVFDVHADGSTIYAATSGGLSISTNGGANFTNFTTSTTPAIAGNGVLGVHLDGSTIYAATNGGLSISTNGGASFTNKTTADGLGSNGLQKVYANGLTVYAATISGLSISTNGGASFTNKTIADGLGTSFVSSVYAVGSTVYAGTQSGLSISSDGGATFTTTFTTSTTPAIGNNSVRGVYADGSNVYASTDGGLSISADCPPSGSSASPNAASASPGIPGIFLAVNEVLVGTPVDGAPVYCGADAIEPNSTYSLSVQSVMNSALTRTILASGTVSSRGHLNERFQLPALNPGTYKVVMTGTHRSGHLLVLTNYLTVGANGSIETVSAESQQPFLN